MSISVWLEELPVENWAATVARTARRVRRRIARKPVRTLGSGVAVVGVLLIGANALWDQDSRHPAPLWSQGGDAGAQARLLGAHAPVRQAEDDSAGPDPLVEQFQAGLADMGLYDGAVDGILDERTASAIGQFEASRGLTMTGKPSVGALAALGEGADGGGAADDQIAALTGGSEAISITAASLEAIPPVRTAAEIQAALNRVGYGPLTVDGVMGPNTQSALARFAESQGMAGSGMTPAVLTALAAASQ
ncbi:peptidoglycan-binding domain-containing protein [Acuticoccus sp. MNP-M23]|uniref:peptidoglycan-binding domain-containing protein n=1 Tax=Acuticoccus sp. MNP-M23 TaxID=3072793 RepID=UPI002814B664|nr:peptidoglycan-binding domain-containing protein [Acuticoccus sp. MNP-M23]WMS41684.1 peptidoglycan-binding domain-containing protein [Acuticoccus sp. MNP-M23]